MAKQTIDELAVIITANSSRLAPDLNKAKKDFQKFAKDVEASMSGGPPPKPPDMRHVRQAAKDVAALRAQAREAATSVLGFVGKVAATAGTLVAVQAGLSGVAGAIDTVRDSVRAAADLEQTKLGFEVMLGDARRATEMVADVRRFAATTPFNTRDLTDATRQLIAYGINADQVMNDLKMLGDVSAAFGARLPIGDLTYLYGTLYAQQRAFTKDLYQFAGRGIPIWRELGRVTGKSGMELRDMVEDGRVGFEDVRRAFVAMTSAGGQFYGMTARQGQTVAGVIEQMSDAFDMLKIEFGQVVIEEFGIKQAAKDLQAFADRLRENSGEIRPFIKFVGDLAKAGAQVSYEFARAGVETARLNLSAYADALPGLREAAQQMKRILEDAAGFKLNEKDVIDVAFAFGKAMADATVGWGRQVADVGQAMTATVRWLVEGAREAKDTLREAADWLNSINNSLVVKVLKDPIRAPLRMVMDQVRFSVPEGRADGAPMQQPWDLAPPVPGLSPDRIRAEYRSLTAYIELQQALLSQALDDLAAGRGNAAAVHLRRDRLADAHRYRGEYVGRGFEGDPLDVSRALDAGNVPRIRGAAPPAPSGGFDGILRGLEDVFSKVRGWNAGNLRDDLERARVRAQEALALRQLGDAAREAATQLRGLPTGNPLHDLVAGAAALHPPGPPDRAAQSLATFSAGLGGPAGLFHVAPPPIPPDVDALRADIRRQYDPMVELGPYRAQLDQIQSRGLLGPNTDAMTNRAWRDRLTQVGGRFGIEPNGRYQLPEAAEVGTREDARIVTAWQMSGQKGNQQMTVDQLLQQILAVAQQQLAATQNIPNGLGAKMPQPKVVKLPGE